MFTLPLRGRFQIGTANQVRPFAFPVSLFLFSSFALWPQLDKSPSPLPFSSSMQPALIVHGGAWDIPDDAVDACNDGCRNALAAGWELLSRGVRRSKPSKRPSSFSKMTRSLTPATVPISIAMAKSNAMPLLWMEQPSAPVPQRVYTA